MRVVGHSDVAPERKTDPGELFDWPMLAAAGVGFWPDAEAVRARLEAQPEAEPDTIGRNLERIGYRWPEEPGSAGAADARGQAAVLAAFQRHFRPGAITGAVDRETAALAAAVAAAGIEPEPGYLRCGLDPDRPDTNLDRARRPDGRARPTGKPGRVRKVRAPRKHGAG